MGNPKSPLIVELERMNWTGKDGMKGQVERIYVHRCKECSVKRGTRAEIKEEVKEELRDEIPLTSKKEAAELLYLIRGCQKLNHHYYVPVEAINEFGIKHHFGYDDYFLRKDEVNRAIGAAKKEVRSVGGN